MSNPKTLDLWAPKATRVDLVLPATNERLPMTPGEPGSFTIAAPPHGTDYAFSLDGGPSIPDPRSPYQPAGVHAASRTVDHEAFSWSDAEFHAVPLADAILYELHPGTFAPAGTWDAAAHRLDHLVRLGVTHISLMPAAAYPGEHGWGYDGVALFAPHAATGGPFGLKRFVDACHARGIAVILDVVYNHLGPDGNYLAHFAPYFTTRYHTPWGWAPNLDGPDSDRVRRFFLDNALMWLRDYHMDGLRIDAVHAIVDESATHLLEELAVEVAALAESTGRPRLLIAESDLNDPRICRPREQFGFGLDAQWSDDFHHALHALMTGEKTGYYQDFGRLADLARALTEGWVYNGQHAAHRRRRHGRPLGSPDGHRLLGYLQTHDQIGNRARGERIGQLCGDRLARVGAVLVMTAPFVPMLFQGEEWGASTPFQYFTDHTSPELGEAVRRGRRAEFKQFGWAPETIPDPQDDATFRRSRLDWDEVGRAPHADTLAFFRELIALRKREPDLRDGRLDRVVVSFDEERRWIRVVRGSVTVCANLGTEEASLPPPAGEIALATEAPRFLSRELLVLPPHSATVIITHA